jgi:hypothetical protein
LPDPAELPLGAVPAPLLGMPDTEPVEPVEPDEPVGDPDELVPDELVPDEPVPLVKLLPAPLLTLRALDPPDERRPWKNVIKTSLPVSQPRPKPMRRPNLNRNVRTSCDRAAQ